MAQESEHRIKPDDAAARARAVLGLPSASPGSVFHVRRLDRDRAGYYLVVFQQQEGGAVALDDITGAPEQWASGAESPVTVDIETARAVAGLGPDADAELVWAPSRASMSPLYPMWEVRGAGQRRFVDQSKHAWDTLVSGGPG